MGHTILYIDGENLRNYLKMVLKNEGINFDSPGLENFDYSKLFNTVLKGISVSSKIFYVARLREHKES